MRLVHDRSNTAYGRYQILVNSGANYGDVGCLLRLLLPGAHVAGLDFRDSFLHRLALPVSRRLLGVRRPVSGQSAPFGLGPSPDWIDKYVEEIIRVATGRRPSSRVSDFVGHLRPVERGGGRVPLFISLAQSLPLLTRIGFRYQMKEGMRRRPCRSSPWIGSSRKWPVLTKGGDVVA